VVKIFEFGGFEVKTNQIIPGFCGSYEIDFVAKRGDLVYIDECKLKQEPGEESIQKRHW
jgi:hypothetical protein